MTTKATSTVLKGKAVQVDSNLEAQALFDPETWKLMGKGRKYRLDPPIPMQWKDVAVMDNSGNVLKAEFVGVARYVMPDGTNSTVVYPVTDDDQIISYIPLLEKRGLTYWTALKELGYEAVGGRRQHTAP